MKSGQMCHRMKLCTRVSNQLKKSILQTIFCFLDIIVCIGAAIEENQEDHYISKKSGAKARVVLVLIWIVSGFLLSISYKSVLRSNMIHIQYESPIDSVEDLLQTNLQVFVDGTSNIAKLTAGDKRQRMIEMNKRVKHFAIEDGIWPSWVPNG